MSVFKVYHLSYYTPINCSNLATKLSAT
jgi:hypothetical protein